MGTQATESGPQQAAQPENGLTSPSRNRLHIASRRSTFPLAAQAEHMNWRPGGGRRKIARLFARTYRNDHSISFSTAKLRTDLLKIEIPAKAEHGGNEMFHILWYLIIGLFAG